MATASVHYGVTDNPTGASEHDFSFEEQREDLSGPRLRNLPSTTDTTPPVEEDLEESGNLRLRPTAPPPVVEPVEEDTGYVNPDVNPIIVEAPRHMSFGSNFPTLIYQLRSLQMIALIVQICVLYMESDRMGLSAAVPFAIHVLNMYHTGKRLYLNIDGRFDLQQIFNVTNILLKTRYVHAIFGSMFYSILGLLVSGSVPSTASAVLYSLSKYATIGASGLVLLAECYEVIMMKLGQRSNLLSKQL